MKHYLGVCLILVTLAALVLFVLHGCASLADRTVRDVRSAFAEVFQVRPQITVNQR